jgi:hypothetical protein
VAIAASFGQYPAMYWVFACASTFGTGFLYLIGAIPAGKALGLPLWLAALCAWLGYSSGGLAAFILSAEKQAWLMGKLKIDPHAEHPHFIVRVWRRFGLPALGLLAPVTIGPQAGALLAMALGARKWPVIAAISLGALPAVVIFASLVALGVKLTK